LDWQEKYPDKSAAYIHVRRDLMTAPVTLNGKKAYISGAMLTHAEVWEAEDFMITGTWCWEAVRRIIKEGGNFKN